MKATLAGLVLLSGLLFAGIVTDDVATDRVSTTDTVQFNTSFSNGVVEGRMQWNNSDGTLDVGLPGGKVVMQIGQEMPFRCVNKSGATISNGTPVAVEGEQGERLKIYPADADNPTRNYVFGVATEDIDHNKSGYVTSVGLVRDVDTSAWVAGTRLYLSTTAGQYTTNLPARPAAQICVALVQHSDASAGVIMVAPKYVPFSYAMTEATNAYTVADSDVTIYCNAAAGGFTNTLPQASLSEGRILTFKRTDQSYNVVTLVAPSSAIDRQGSATLGQSMAVMTLQARGTNWWIVGGF